MKKNEKKLLNQALGLIIESKEIVEALKDAREAYYDERSGAWQEGEKGEAYCEESDAIEQLLSSIKEAEEGFGELELD